MFVHILIKIYVCLCILNIRLYINYVRTFMYSYI